MDSWVLEYAASKGRHSAFLSGVLPFFQDKSTVSALGSATLKSNFNVLAAMLEEGTSGEMISRFNESTLDVIMQLFVNLRGMIQKFNRAKNFKQIHAALQNLVLTTYRFVKF